MKKTAILKTQSGIGFQLKETGKDYFLELERITYHTNTLTQDMGGFGKLSLKNCQTIERGWDLDDITTSYVESRFNLDQTTIQTFERLHRETFQTGFQKALELLGDKKYSEDDVLNLLSDYGYDLINADNLFEGTPKEWMDKIKQQTEWDVEVEMEEYLENNLSHIEGELPYFKLRPKLDADGCLILKRKENV